MRNSHLIITFLLCCFLGCNTEQDSLLSDQQKEQIRKDAIDYMEAIDAGDLDRQMSMWSRDSNATSIIVGDIWRGIDNIRARSAEYVPISKLMRNELSDVKVNSLGVNDAFTILSFHAVRRKPADEYLKPYELESLLTLIWQRTDGRWKIIHEHVSVKMSSPIVESPNK